MDGKKSRNDTACGDFIKGDSFILSRQQCAWRGHYRIRLNDTACESDRLEHSKPNK